MSKQPSKFDLPSYLVVINDYAAWARTYIVGPFDGALEAIMVRKEAVLENFKYATEVRVLDPHEFEQWRSHGFEVFTPSQSALMGILDKLREHEPPLTIDVLDNNADTIVQEKLTEKWRDRGCAMCGQGPLMVVQRDAGAYDPLGGTEPVVIAACKNCGTVDTYAPEPSNG